jgi:predicted transposase YdaD
LLKEFDTTKPEGVKTMITHLEQNFKRYFEEAEKRGEKKVEEKAIRIAQNFLAMGIAVEAVAKATELPVEKILELQKPPQH